MERLPVLKGMVQRDERRGLGQAVALNDDEAQPPPELFGLGIERSAAGDEGPELPSELVVDSAEAPPAAHEVLVFRRLELALEARQPARCFQVAQDLVFQRLHQARHGDHHRDALALDDAHHLGRVQRVLEDARSRPAVAAGRCRGIVRRRGSAAADSGSARDGRCARSGGMRRSRAPAARDWRGCCRAR